MERFDDSRVIENITPVHLAIGALELDGDLGLPEHPRGMVLFAHGSGSSRHSPRNRFVARELRQHGFGTLLLDLLTPDEEREDMMTARLRFDIALLAERLGHAVSWLKRHGSTRGLPIGLFGASTGGGAALLAASEHPERIAAVVSRGGRPDLAAAALDRVRAPTLLIVGERDEPVIELNELALSHLVHAPARLEIVEGATHLFEEPGALEVVAHLATEWFRRWLHAEPAGRTHDRAA